MGCYRLNTKLGAVSSGFLLLISLWRRVRTYACRRAFAVFFCLERRRGEVLALTCPRRLKGFLARVGDALRASSKESIPILALLGFLFFLDPTLAKRLVSWSIVYFLAMVFLRLTLDLRRFDFAVCWAACWCCCFALLVRTRLLLRGEGMLYT